MNGVAGNRSGFSEEKAELISARSWLGLATTVAEPAASAGTWTGPNERFGAKKTNINIKNIKSQSEPWLCVRSKVANCDRFDASDKQKHLSRSGVKRRFNFRKRTENCLKNPE